MLKQTETKCSGTLQTNHHFVALHHNESDARPKGRAFESRPIRDARLSS